MFFFVFNNIICGKKEDTWLNQERSVLTEVAPGQVCPDWGGTFVSYRFSACIKFEFVINCDQLTSATVTFWHNLIKSWNDRESVFNEDRSNIAKHSLVLVKEEGKITYWYLQTILSCPSRVFSGHKKSFAVRKKLIVMSCQYCRAPQSCIQQIHNSIRSPE